MEKMGRAPPSEPRCTVPALAFLVSGCGFEFRVWGFGFRVQGFGLRVSGCESRESNLEGRV